MKAISRIYRIFVVLSVAWVLFCASDLYNSGMIGISSSRFELDKFIMIGLLPVLAVWGIVWVVKK